MDKYYANAMTFNNNIWVTAAYCLDCCLCLLSFTFLFHFVVTDWTDFLFLFFMPHRW